MSKYLMFGNCKTSNYARMQSTHKLHPLVLQETTSGSAVSGKSLYISNALELEA